MVKSFVTLILFILLAGFIALTDSQEPSHFVLEGTADLVIVNQTGKTVKVKNAHWIAVPFHEYVDSLVVARNETGTLLLSVQGPSEYSLTIDDQIFTLFSRPGSVDTAFVYPAEERVNLRFGGPLTDVNEYLISRDTYFGSSESMYRPRAEATQTAKNVVALFAINDSIHSEYSRYLSSYEKDLPEWYIRFEQKHLFFINEGFKMNSIFYRNSLMGMREELPEGYLDKLRNNESIESEEMLGDIKYIQFLVDYVHAFGDSSILNQYPESLQQWFDRFVYFDSIALEYLDGPVKDVYIANSFSKRLNKHAYLFQEHWLDLIEDKQLQALVRKEFQIDRLPPGNPAPYFNLETTDGQFVQLSDYAGKVVLINFWATWCRPCIQEFPRENRLVEKFEKDPLEIINICIDSDKDAWLRYINKYDLSMVNLFASDTWSNNLKKNYFVQSLPHSVLIDAGGKIIKNKAPRASMGVDSDIRQALREME